MATTRFRLLLALVLSVALLGSACGLNAEGTVTDAAASGDDAAFDTDDGGSVETDDVAAMAQEEDAMEDVAEGEPAADRASSDALGAAGATPTGLTAAQQGREIIFTANVAVEVDDVAAAGERASQIVDDLGGFVSGLETVTEPVPQSIITFKVLPDNFSAALERVSGIGELQNQRVTTDDVTERVVDLESRIDVAQLGVDRLREAMENAPDLEDFAQLEALLLSRESDLEVMRGQLRTLRDRIDLATITLVLTETRIDNEIRVTISIYPGHDNGVSCPGGRDLPVERDTEVTLCIEVANIGDEAVQNVAITDTVLGITSSTDLVTVFGTLDEIPAGQTAEVAFEFVPERDLQLRTRASATPTSEEGRTSPAVTAEAGVRINTFEAETDPGFRDGFDAATDLLQAVWIGLTVLIGFVVPLLVLAPLLFVAIWAWRRRQRAIAEQAKAHTPPPPRSWPSASEPAAEEE